MLRKLLVALSAIALVVGLAPAATAQNTSSKRISDFTFTATINTGQSQLRPGGYVRIDLTAKNTHGTCTTAWGVCLPGTDSRVLNTYGFTVPAGYTLRGSGGNDMTNVGTHDQGNYFGGQPGNIPDPNRIVPKNSSRSGWLSFTIPTDARGGSVHNFGIRTHLGTGGSWHPTAENAVGFTLGPVATTTTVTADPATVQEGATTTLTADVAAVHGSNAVSAGTMEFVMGGASIGTAPVGPNGRASIPYTAPLLDNRDPLTQTVTARFSGVSRQFSASSATTTVRIEPQPKSEVTSTIGLTATRGLVEDGRLPVTLEVAIDASSGLDLPAGARVEIVRDDVVVDTVPVSGIAATLTDQLDATTEATYVYTARLLETETSDTIYRAAVSDPVEVEVAPEVTPQVTVGVDPATVLVGRAVDISATVTADGAPLPAGTEVIIRSNGRDIGTVQTGADGTAVLSGHTFDAPGDKSIVAVFAGGRIDGTTYRAVTSTPATLTVGALPGVDTGTTIALQAVATAGDEVTITAKVSRLDDRDLTDAGADDLGAVWFFQDGEAVGSAPVVVDPATGQATAVLTHRFAERGEFRITADYSGAFGTDEELAPSETAGATVVTVLPSRIEIDEPGPPSNEIDLSFGSLDLGSVMDLVGPEGLASLGNLVG